MCERVRACVYAHVGVRVGRVGGVAGDPGELRQLLEGRYSAQPVPQDAHQPHRHGALRLVLRRCHAPAPQGGAGPPEVDLSKDHDGSDAASDGRYYSRLGCVTEA